MEKVLVCSHCDTESETVNDSEYCQKCYDELYVCCKDCDDFCLKEDATLMEEGYVCEDCSSTYVECERCDDVVHENNSSTVCYSGRDRTWCDDCTESYAERCDDCHDLSSNDDMYRSSDGQDICSSCRYSGDWYICDDCGDLVNCDEVCSREDSDESYCTRCWRNQTPKVIREYSYKPTPEFFGKGDMFFGIELEVEKSESKTDKHEMATSIVNKHWYFKSDGSLSNGFEIVTHPMSPDYIKENESDFKDMLIKLSSAGYKSYDAGTCGLHIHISKKAFGTWHLYRFMKFFVDNRDFIVSISQRKKEQLERWATIEEESHGSLIYKAKNKSGNSKRYLAINLQNDETVEIRIFRGTLKPSSFFKNIEFTSALFAFSRDEKEMTIELFKEYIAKSNEYSLLKKFIKDKNI